MDKIYSRRRLIIPKFNINVFYKNKKNENNKKNIIKIVKIAIILAISFFTFNKIIEAINPIIDKQCQLKAKSVATKISNEQATIVMNKYKYDDLCTVGKDNNRKNKYHKCKCKDSK